MEFKIDNFFKDLKKENNLVEIRKKFNTEKFKNFFKKFLIFYLLNFFLFSTAKANNLNQKNNVLNLKNENVLTVNKIESKILKRLVNWGYEERENREIKGIVIHNVYNPYKKEKRYDLEEILKIFKEYNVSSHYLIDRNGKIYQLVLDKNVSYHAGKSTFLNKKDKEVNEITLAIELINAKNDKITNLQYNSLKELVKYLKEKYNIEVKNIVGHKQIAPKRKTDPWNFDLNKFLKDLEK